MKLRRPSHATVIAYLALFAALGGSAIAVSKVGSNGLKNGAVTSPKIRNHAVKAKDLTPIAFRSQRRNVSAGNTALSDAVARCRKNETLITGGGGWITDGNLTSVIADRKADLVQVRGTNPDGSADTLLAQAICLRK
jgi:hypothetical protein